MEALHGEVTGLQLKVQSLQGIIDIQEQQLKAAAGQSSDAQDQVGLYLLFTNRHFNVARWSQESVEADGGCYTVYLSSMLYDLSSGVCYV